MLHLVPKSLAAAAILTAGLAWAQTDEADPLPAPPDSDTAAETQAEAADSAADADTGEEARSTDDIPIPEPPADEDAAPSEGAAAEDEPRTQDEGTAEPAEPAADAEAEADAEADAPRRTPERGSDAATEGRSGSREGTRGRADAGVRAGDVEGRAALGVVFRTDGDPFVIRRVYPNSPAARLGLRPGDRIVELNGQEFDDIQVFIDAAGRVSLDEDAEIVYMRDGRRYIGRVRFMPWVQVFVDDDRDAVTPRRALRPDLDDAEDLEDAAEEGRIIPAPPGEPVPQPEIEIDD